MITEKNNKAELREWGRNFIHLSNVGAYLSFGFSMLWIAILIWSNEGSQWKIPSILGAVTSITIVFVFVAVRRRLYSFMTLLASEFVTPDQ